MAQLLLIKSLGIDSREIDDIVGFFESGHKFSNDEKVFFNIQQVEGYTIEAITEFARNKQPKRQRIYKSITSNAWTLEVPEKKIAWKKDGKWYFLEKEPKFMFTIKNMTEEEKAILNSELSSAFDKLNALAHLECKIDMDSGNMVEISELN